MEAFSDDLLCPDAEDYSFDRYFVYNYTAHEIEINAAATEVDKHKALVTRDIFQFKLFRAVIHGNGGS